MRYFIDTEFYERPGRIDLISIGVVRENETKYYAENLNAPFQEIEDLPDQWLQKNVIDKLKNEDMKPLAEIKSELLAFFAPDPEPIFWGYFSDYDWVVFCWIFGRMIDLPKSFPMFCLDLKQAMFMLSGKVKGRPPIPQLDGEHNALTDARWNKELWEALGEP